VTEEQCSHHPKPVLHRRCDCGFGKILPKYRPSSLHQCAW